MSKTIDERIVEMRFDNKQFEEGVQTSLSTLDKLKKGLDLDGAAKGLEGLNDAARKCDLSTLSRSVEDRSGQIFPPSRSWPPPFQYHQFRGQCRKRLLSSLTIEPITTGFNEYEQKMGSIQTIMASTGEKLGPGQSEAG